MNDVYSSNILILLFKKVDYSNEDFENNPKAVISNYVTNFIIGPTIPVGPAIPTDSIDVGYTVKGPWITETQIHPLVKIKLGQGKPYNKYCITSKGDTINTGCAPIAVIQMMSVHQYPNTIGGLTYNWNTIINRYKTYTPAQDVLAHWIRTIGGQCTINYNQGKTGCYPNHVANCLSSYQRYTNINIINDPSYEDVYSMLENDKPLLFAAWDEIEVDSIVGHIWVVDGCIYQKQCVQMFNGNDILIGEYYVNRDYVHCNWGWNGSCNGYYITNVFNLNNGAPIPDEGTNGSGNLYLDSTIVAIKYNII